ncbi:MAG: hypothetical protein U0228_32590 [Myxococcaceae bacterium]
MTTLRFHSVPAWQLIDPKKRQGAQPHEESGEQELTVDSADLEAALERVEYRGAPAWQRAVDLTKDAATAVYARSPNDLPALLRTADQLLTVARVAAGERAQVWRCTCGAPVAVPVSLVRPVSVRCERCGNTLELDPSRSEGQAQLADPKVQAANTARQALAAFFREAMARGWPVLVSRVTS